MALSVRRLRNDVLRRWCAPLVVALATVLVAPVAAHAKGAPVKGSPAKDRVEIGGLVAQTGGAWAVLTSPPPSDRKRLLGSDAFTVTVDGSDVAARAQARVPADLGVALVVSAGVGGKDVKVEQDAAIETVLGLPKATRAALVVQGTTPKVAVPLSTDRRAVTDAIGKVERSPDSSTLSALSLAADAIKSAPRRAIILFGPPGFVSPSEMASSARKLAARNVALFSIAPSKPQEAIADAVLATGGHTAAYGSATSSDGAVEAGRAIGAQLATQYLVTFTPRAKLTSHSKISVALDGVQGSRAKVSPLLLPGGANALGKTGRKGHHHLKRKLAAGAAAVLLLIVIALLVVVLRRRRRARAEPAFRVPATHVAVTPPAENASGASASVVTGGRHRHPLGASPRAGQVDDALDRLDAFASRWQPRSQGIFYAREALAIHEPLGIQLSLDELSRATALDAVTTPIAPVVRTIEALRWGLVRRSQGTRWSDIAVEVAAVVRGDLDPAELMRGVTGRNGTSIDAARQLERLPGRPGLEDEVPLREPVRAAAIARERVLEYQWFGPESEIVSRVLIPVLLYDRAPAAVPYLGISRHLGEDTDVSTFYQAATAAADEATRRVVQLRALRSRYQAELDARTEAVIELLFSVPVVTAGYLSERLDGSAATVTELMDHLVSAGVVEPLLGPTRRGDPAWVAIEVLGVFESGPVAATITLADPDPADAEPPDRSTPRRRAAPARPRQLRTRPRP